MLRPWTFAIWSFWNRASFAWRRLWRRSRAGLVIPQDPWETLFPEGSELAKEAQRLRERYGLDWPDEHANQRENLHVVGLLDAALKPVAVGFPRELEVLDIGAKDWHYLPGMYRFLERVGTRTPRRVQVTGIELDAYYRYQDGYTRRDYAETYARGLNAAYRVGDVLAHEGTYDLVLLLHPFWREREVLAWGLPSECFAIERMLQHAYARVTPGGSLLVTAYRSEAPWAESTLGRMGWEARGEGIWRSPFVRATPSLYWVFQRPPA